MEVNSTEPFPLAGVFVPWLTSKLILIFVLKANETIRDVVIGVGSVGIRLSRQGLPGTKTLAKIVSSSLTSPGTNRL